MNNIIHFLFDSISIMMATIGLVWKDARSKWIVATVAVATVAVAGTALGPKIPIPGGGGPPPGGDIGNLWLAPSASNNCSGGRSSTRIDYSTAVSTNHVCTNMNSAYVAANTSDLVLIRSGSYGGQIIAAAGAKAGAGLECDSIAPGSNLAVGQYPVRVTDYSDCIYFRPENGASVSFGELQFLAPYVYLDGGTTPSISVSGGINFGSSDANCSTSHDTVVSGIQTNNAMFMKGSHNTIQFSDFNLGDDWQRNTVSQFNGGCPPTANLVYRNTFRNLYQYQPSNQTVAGESHMECIHHRIGTDSVFDSNKFFNCAQYNLSIQADGGPNINVKVINNVLDDPCSGQDGPAAGVKMTGTFVSGSNVVTGISSTTNIDIGDGVYSVNLPYQNNVLNPPTVPTVQSKTSSTITLSQNATASRTSVFGAGGYICGNINPLQYAGGATFSNPFTAFNSFYNGVDSYDNGPGPITGAISYGNIKLARSPFFCANATYYYLVDASDWPSSYSGASPCGTGSVVGTASYVDQQNNDFRITGNSAANNLVPANFSRGVPSMDVNGNSRTGSLFDAGAYDSTAAAP